jgi:hypothetical protein
MPTTCRRPAIWVNVEGGRLPLERAGGVRRLPLPLGAPIGYSQPERIGRVHLAFIL